MRVLALALVALVGTVAAIDYQACTNDYAKCVEDNPFNYDECLDTYYECIGYTSVEKPTSMKSVTQCVNEYQSCITDNPYNWESCLNTYNYCVNTATSWASVDKKPIAAFDA